MKDEKIITSYYKDTLPEIIEKLKDMVENNLEIVGRNINPELPDNKLKNALESRRESGEDVIWACKEVDRMEFEYQGIDEDEQDDYLETSYFRRIIPRLIKELKGMIENNLKVVGKAIKTDIGDDKMKASLSSRRLGAEDAVWASKQVDELERILIGKSEAKEEFVAQSWTKRKASS